MTEEERETVIAHTVEIIDAVQLVYNESPLPANMAFLAIISGAIEVARRGGAPFAELRKLMDQAYEGRVANAGN